MQLLRQVESLPLLYLFLACRSQFNGSLLGCWQECKSTPSLVLWAVLGVLRYSLWLSSGLPLASSGCAALEQTQGLKDSRAQGLKGSRARTSCSNTQIKSRDFLNITSRDGQGQRLLAGCHVPSGLLLSICYMGTSIAQEVCLVVKFFKCQYKFSSARVGTSIACWPVQLKVSPCIKFKCWVDCNVAMPLYILRSRQVPPCIVLGASPLRALKQHETVFTKGGHAYM